jgi:hypothetical protein
LEIPGKFSQISARFFDGFPFSGISRFQIGPISSIYIGNALFKNGT